MPATPAWPPESTPRLFVDQPLSEGRTLTLAGNQGHYLTTVMRLRSGDPVKLFDDRSGEWLATITATGKRDVALEVRAHLRPREEVPDLWLLAAPIKRARIDWVAEKATELGVALYQPIITQRTIIERLNLDRLRGHMIEAAEQCGRTALPSLEEPVKLSVRLSGWHADRQLFFADEQGGQPLAEAVKDHPGPAALLIGPEGGFTQEERQRILSVPQAVPVSLGPRILRAETAALAAIAIWVSAST